MAPTQSAPRCLPLPQPTCPRRPLCLHSPRPGAWSAAGAPGRGPRAPFSCCWCCRPRSARISASWCGGGLAGRAALAPAGPDNRRSSPALPCALQPAEAKGARSRQASGREPREGGLGELGPPAQPPGGAKREGFPPLSLPPGSAPAAPLSSARASAGRRAEAQPRKHPRLGAPGGPCCSRRSSPPSSPGCRPGLQSRSGGGCVCVTGYTGIRFAYTTPGSMGAVFCKAGFMASAALPSPSISIGLLSSRPRVSNLGRL